MTAPGRRSLRASQQCARLAVPGDEVLLREVVTGATGVIHRTVFAGVEVIVIIRGKGRENAVEDRSHEQIERLTQRRFLVGELESVLCGVGLACDEGLDCSADRRDRKS